MCKSNIEIFIIQFFKNMSKYKEVLKELKDNNVSLVLVSKRKTEELIREFYGLGQRDFGENRVQELVAKYDALPKDIRWHQIGHLQKNKVKYIAPFIHLIHAVDNYTILEEINKRAKSKDRVIDVLLQIKIAKEDSKFGLSKEDCISLISNPDVLKMQNIRIRGLMGMSTFTHDMEIVRVEFKILKEFFNLLKNEYFKHDKLFSEISMGMSGDYKIAIEEETTMVRIGTLIMGNR